MQAPEWTVSISTNMKPSALISVTVFCLCLLSQNVVGSELYDRDANPGKLESMQMNDALQSNVSGEVNEAVDQLVESFRGKSKHDIAIKLTVMVNGWTQPTLYINAAKKLKEAGFPVIVDFNYGKSDKMVCMDILDDFIDADLVDLNKELSKCAANRFDLVSFLLGRGADINYQDQTGLAHPFNTLVLSRGIRNPQACDYWCIARLIHLNPRLDFTGLYGGFIKLALDYERPDIAKLLIRSHAVEPNIWNNIATSGQYSLFEEALLSGYEVSPEEREFVLTYLYEKKMYDRMGKFLKFDWSCLNVAELDRILNKYYPVFHEKIVSGDYLADQKDAIANVYEALVEMQDFRDGLI